MANRGQVKWGGVAAPPYRGIAAARPSLAALSCAALLAAAPASADQFWETSYLVSISAGGDLSTTARRLGAGGYELSDGTPLVLRDWYASRWQDLRFTWMTQIGDNFGLYWGFGTGERDRKYAIDPSLRVGFIATQPVTRHGTLSLSVTGVLGGLLRERPCIADYGAIGGIQAVNCRLAATPLPPADTLRYLVHERPGDQVQVSLRYVILF